MNQEIINQIKERLHSIENGLTKAEFQASFKALMDLVLKTEKGLVERNQKINSELLTMFGSFANSATNKVSTEVAKKLTDGLKELKTALRNETKEIISELKTSIEEIKQNLSDSKSVNEAKLDILAATLRKEMPVIPEQKVYDATPLTQEIEKLKDDIKLLGEEMTNVKETRRFGGGHTDIGIIYTLGRIGKTETPSGAINGSNTVYTVSQPIHFIFSFSINGQAIEDSQYTVAGNTITFTSAIDASLSGTNFRIKYA